MPLKFPFSSVRQYQNELIDDVKVSVSEGRHLIANAPTGMGKTIAALYPALEYAEGSGKNVLFLTSRLSQHKMAIETAQNIGVPAIDIVGKKWLCSHSVQDMDAVMFSNFCSSMIHDGQCKYYKNFRQKEITPQAREMIDRISRVPAHSEDAKKMAGGRFCTYEILMEAAKKSPLIVCDYFHIFSPNEKKFFKRIEKNISDSIIIVDEAHNLPARIRKNLSSKISTRILELAKKEDRKFGLGVADYIECIENAVTSIAKQKLIPESESFIEKGELMGRIEKRYNYKSLVNFLSKASVMVLEEKKISFLDRVVSFLESWEGPDFGYSRIISRSRYSGKDHIAITFDCMDPSIISGEIINNSHSTVLMSGTLSPMEMYRDLLGMNTERTTMRNYPSPFPASNRLNIVVSDVTTRYKKRTEEGYAKLARTVAVCSNAIKGNAAVFFPSYEMMKRVYAICGPDIKKPVFMEEQGMAKEDRKRLQDGFAARYKDGAVLLGVLAGSFSEGIDLPGDKLNGVVIVGLPLEKPNLSSRALIEYYDKRFKNGMNYGYIYPAMIKVMQAAGRCIRTETDRGVCVFADERFLWSNYRNIFPADMNFIAAKRPEIEIRKFFS